MTAHCEDYSEEYNTAIKDIAGIADYEVIFNIVNANADRSIKLTPRIIDESGLHVRTSRTKTKISWAIDKAILQYSNENHKNLVNKVFRDKVPSQDKKFAFFWHFCINNKLFREISTNVFTEMYFSGRVQISKEDIIDYIKEISCRTTSIKPNWSKDTIYRLATKYLSLMTKLGFVTNGRIKTFNNIYLSNEALIIFLYFSNLQSPISKNLYDNELLPTSFMDSDEIYYKLKKLSVNGLFNMSFDGIKLKIDLSYSYGEICDVIYI